MCFGRLIITPDAYNPYLNENLLPKIEKATVTGTIINTFATLSFCEEFKTHKKDFYEIYINPPEGCVIYNIKTKYNDKTTEFVIHQLEEPALNGNYDLNSNSDAINLTLGYIQSDISVTIEISCTFTAVLSSQNSYTFHFPFDSESSNTNFSANLLLTNFSQNQPKIKISEGSFKIENEHLILPEIKITQEFQLTFEISESVQSSAFSNKIGKYNYIGITLHPNSFDYNQNCIKQEIYLLIDCSGSMSGQKIRNAQTALINFLKSLPKNCYFNIIRFGSSFEQMFEHCVENNEDNISESLKYAQTIDADLGGTDIYSPLMSIIDEKPKKGYVRQVFAITDGEVESPANVIAACTKNRHTMRIFPFGIGSDVNHAFIKELAKSTMGTERFITNNSSNTISDEVLLALKSSQVGAIVNSQIHLEGIDSFEFAPHPVPSLFADKLTHVILRYECEDDNTGNSILVNGECGDERYEETIVVNKLDQLIDLEKLFAYHNIRDMEDRLINSTDQKESKIIKENIIELSIQCSVVSSFTGMFTVINGVEQKPEDLQKEMEKYNDEIMKEMEIFPPQQQPQQLQLQPQQLQLQPQQLQPQPQQFQLQPQQLQLQPQQLQPQPQQFQLQPQQFQLQPQQLQPQPQPQQLQPQPQQLQLQSNIKQFQPQQYQYLQQAHPQYQFQPCQMQSVYQQKQQLCQQPMTQKQFRNQQAFSQVQQPIQQLKKSWGNSKVHQQMQSKIVKKQISKVQMKAAAKPQIKDDEIIFNLLKSQNSNGSWSDISIIDLLVNTKAKNPTIQDLLIEYPSLKINLAELDEEFIITLLVIGWLNEQKNRQSKSYETEIQKGNKYILSHSKQRNVDYFQILSGVSWKTQI